jgi:hypothetical protein
MRLSAIALTTALLFLLVIPISFAATPTLNITIREAVSERLAFDPINGERKTGVSSTGIELAPIAFDGNISITNVASETISDINITLRNTSNIANQFQIVFQPSYTNVNISPFQPRNDTYVFIRELHPGDRVVLHYKVSNLNFGEPINITEVYTKIKVLTNSTFNITMNVSNSLTSNITIFDINITKTPFKHLGADGNPRYFNFSQIYGNDTKYARIGIIGGRSVLEWNISNRTMKQNEYGWIGFVTRAPVDLNTTWNDTNWGRYMVIGNITVNFLMNTSISGLNIGGIYSVAKAQLSAIKTRINESHWKIGVNFTDKSSTIDYNLTRLTVWATYYNQFRDPGNISTWVNNTKSPYLQGSPDSFESQNLSWEVNNTLNKVTTLDVDLNKDQIYFEYVNVFNGTHLLFNLSGNKGIYAKLVNTSGASLNISYCSSVNQQIEINESNITDGKVYGSFRINGTCNKDNAITTTMFMLVNSTHDSFARYTWNPNQNIAAGGSWQNNTFNFNYSEVPEVWARVNYRITDTPSQMTKAYRISENSSGYYFWEEIYVLSGYILKATKFIMPSNRFDNVYNVTVVIENIGNDKTPDLITVYDMIPQDFWLINLTNNMTDNNDKTIINGININITMNNLTRGINNTGYIKNNNSLFNNYWGFRIDFKPLRKGSNDDGVYDLSLNKSEIKIFYMINGTGQLSHIKNAFIVGIDPVRLEGANPGRAIAAGFGLESNSSETITLLLSMLAVVGLLGMTYGVVKKPTLSTNK